MAPPSSRRTAAASIVHGPIACRESSTACQQHCSGGQQADSRADAQTAVWARAVLLLARTRCSAGAARRRLLVCVSGEAARLFYAMWIKVTAIYLLTAAYQLAELEQLGPVLPGLQRAAAFEQDVRCFLGHARLIHHDWPPAPPCLACCVKPRLLHTWRLSQEGLAGEAVSRGGNIFGKTGGDHVSGPLERHAALRCCCSLQPDTNNNVSGAVP